MNQEKQRIAIAEACGWKKSTWAEQGYTKGATEGEIWRGPDKCGWRSLYSDDDRPGDPYPFPDYLNSLDAMHEAEERVGALEPGARRRYAELLQDWLGANGAIFTTAAQRAESFLKALGLWEEP